MSVSVGVPAEALAVSLSPSEFSGVSHVVVMKVPFDRLLMQSAKPSLSVPQCWEQFVSGTRISLSQHDEMSSRWGSIKAPQRVPLRPWVSTFWKPSQGTVVLFGLAVLIGWRVEVIVNSEGEDEVARNYCSRGSGFCGKREYETLDIRESSSPWLSLVLDQDLHATSGRPQM